MSRLFVGALLGSIFISHVGFGAPSPELEGFIKESTRLGARGLIAQAVPVAELVAAYPQLDPAGKPMLLRAVVASAQGPERESFLKQVSQDPQASELERFIAGFSDLLDTPQEAKRQDALVKFLEDHRDVRADDFDFGFHDERGLALLTAILDRSGQLDSTWVGAFAAILRRDFPRETNETLIPIAERLTQDLLKAAPKDYFASLYQIAELFPAITDEVWAEKYVASLLTENSLTDLGNLHEGLVSNAVIRMPIELSSGFGSQLAAFYCNADTDPKPKTESSESWGWRRGRLLNFAELVLALKKVNRSEADRFALANLECFAKSDVAEASFLGLRIVQEVENPRRAVATLMQSSNAPVLISALRMIREREPRFWSQAEGGYDFEGRVLQLSHLGLPAIPENVRIEAGESYRYLRNTEALAPAVLAGLGSADSGTRLRSVWLLQNAPMSPMLLEVVGRVIENDPDPEVRMAALKLVEERIEDFAPSRKIGFQIFMLWDKGSKELLEVAGPALDAYVEKSPWAYELLKKGNTSSVEAIRDLSKGYSKQHVISGLSRMRTVLGLIDEPTPKNMVPVFESFRYEMTRRIEQAESDPKP